MLSDEVTAPQIVTILQEADAKINENTAEGHFFTAIHFAIIEGKLEVVQILFDAGANINPPSDLKTEQDTYPVKLAIDHNHKEIAEFLIQHGALVYLEWLDELEEMGITADSIPQEQRVY